MIQDDNQELELSFKCFECGKEVRIVDVKKLFDSVNAQRSAENRRLYCDECND